MLPNRFLLSGILTMISLLPVRGSGDLFFNTLSTNDGLQSAITSDIVQDKYGFIWIGTKAGLNRYDGNRMLRIGGAGDNREVADREITCLLDGDRYIWTGTNQGLFKIDVDTKKVFPVNTAGNTIIRTLMAGRDHTLWVGTNTGLVKLAGDSIVEYNTYNSALSHNTIRALYQDRDGGVWVGTQDGLNLLSDGTHFMPFFFKGTYKPNLPNNLVLDIKPNSADCDSILLVGTETGLVTFDRRTHRYSTMNQSNSPLSNEVIKCIHASTDQIWLGTNFGLNVIDRKTGTVKSYFHESQMPYSLSNNVVWRIFRDAGGVLWLLTDNGVNYLNEHSDRIRFRRVFYPYQNREIGKQIRNIRLSQDGAIYSATDNGIIRTHPENPDVDNLPALNRLLLMPNTTDVLSDTFGRLWIGTTGGLNIYDPQSDRVDSRTTRNTPVFNSNYIARLGNFGTGEIFVSIWESGIFRMNESLGRGGEVRISPVSSYPTDKFIVYDNKLWQERYNKILCINLLNGQETEPERLNAALEDRRIEALFMCRHHILYIGTGGGIVRYDIQSETMSFIDTNVPRQESVVNILEDDNGTIWATTQCSLVRIEKDGRITTIGLGDNFPMRQIHPGCMGITRDGVIFCGGDDGFIYFHTDDFGSHTFDPPVYITALHVNNREVGIGQELDGDALLPCDIACMDELSLKYGQRNVSFEFASLSYGAGHLYRYRMEGLDEDWITLDGGKHSAVYSNLPAGRYLLRVQATDDYGRWCDKEASLAVRVYPPFLLRWGFIVLYGVLLGVLVVWLFRISTKRLRLLNEIKLMRLEKEHDREVLNAKIRFFTNISHEFRTPLSLIIPPLREVLNVPNLESGLHRLIDIACQNSEKLLKLVNQLLDFRKMDADNTLHRADADIIVLAERCFDMFRDTAQRRGVRYTFEPQSERIESSFDPDKMETMIYNLLSNAFKFTPDNGTIALAVCIRACRGEQECSKSSRYLDIRVSDSGVGISDADKERIFDDFYRSRFAEEHTVGSGIGLAVVKRYAELHQGSVSVESASGKGSVFTVSIPVEEPEAMIIPGKDFVRKYVDVHDGANVAGDKRPLVLYVEDNPGMVEFVTMSLGKKYRIVSASNGREGYEKCLLCKPQVVVSDIMMPEIDGIAMSRMLRNNPKTRHIPIILLTAKSLAQDQVEALRAGIDLYIVKPVYPEVLDANIEQVLRRRERMEAYFREELVVVGDQADSMQDADRKLVGDIINLIEANISDPELSVEMISREIGLSPTHLYRRIKKLTGLNTNELIRKYRLKKASILIRGNKGTISEIMYYVGFSSSSYFSKCFKAEFGALPSEYKEKNS